MECKVNIPELGCDRKSPKRFREFVERMNRNAERIHGRRRRPLMAAI